MGASEEFHFKVQLDCYPGLKYSFTLELLSWSEMKFLQLGHMRILKWRFSVLNSLWSGIKASAAIIILCHMRFMLETSVLCCRVVDL